MKMHSPWLPVAVLLAVVATLAPGLAGAAELALKRVMLSAGGVGYYEYEATVEGDATLDLSVRLDQVDDVLKSVVVYDDQGRAGAIRLPGREPLQQVFRDLPFGPDALASPTALLQAVPGARIRVSGPRALEGRLVAVVPEQVRAGSGDVVTTRHRVSLVTAAGVQSFLLEDADAVHFTDATLRAQLDAALGAVQAHRTRDRRTLEVVSRGDGRRIVRVGYVVAAPLWKASYRLTLPSGSAAAQPASARLQGWAVLENMSGQAWAGVELTLVSGNPVTFRQALYEAYYVDRPEVPVEVLGRVLPAPDQGAVPAVAAEAAKRERAVAPSPAADAATGGLIGALSMVQPKASAGAAPEPQPAPPPGQARILAAASSEAATSVSFRIPLPVTVASGHSLLVPLVDRQVPAERVSVYQPATHARHPLAAVRLRNDGDTGLPPGVLTLYEMSPRGSSFVGDARIAPLPAGEERLLSYALDQKVLVDREVSDTRTIAQARIVNGALELTQALERRTAYRLRAPAAEPRRLLVEHPRQAGWTLAQPAAEATTLTDDSHRIAQDLAPGESARLDVVLRRPRTQRIALVDLGRARFEAWAGNGELDPAIRDAFREMAALRATLDELLALEREQQRERATLLEEQTRIRDNLARVPPDSDLQQRYLRKLDRQEDLLEALQSRADALRDDIAEARGKLNDYIGSLTL